MQIKKLIRYFNYYGKTFFSRRLGEYNLNPWTNGEYNIVNKLANSWDIVFDAGAFKGEWSQYVMNKSKSSLQIFMFEPSPANYKYLRKKFPDKSNVHLYNYALSNSNITSPFYFESDLSGSNALYDHPQNEDFEQTEVKCVKLDDFIKRKKIQKIDFLKMDIEGAEVPAIQGCIETLQKGKIKFLQIEYNKTWMTAGCKLLEVFNLLKDTDMEIFRIAPKKLIHLGEYNIHLENFNPSNLLLCNPIHLPSNIKILKDVYPFLNKETICFSKGQI